MRPRRWALRLGLATFLVAILAAPAPAANQVRTEASRVIVTVPVDVRGPAVDDQLEVAALLTRQGAALAGERLYGCFSVVPEFVAEDGPEVHVVTVVPQRVGQYVRPTRAGAEDPFAGPVEVSAGFLDLESDATLSGAVPLLLAPGRPEEGGLAALIREVIERTETAASLKPCRFTGTLELETVYDRYQLTVTSTIEFSFTVEADGTFAGTVSPSTREAVSEDDDLGHCEADELAMFRIGLQASGRDGLIELVFKPKGPEPDFTLSCSRGRLELGGDFLKAAFAPEDRLVLELRAMDGATAMHRPTVENLKAVARVTIHRA